MLLLYLKDYKCHRCNLHFSCEWDKYYRPNCPKCGDNADVLRHPKQVRPLKTKRPRWTDEQKSTLWNLHTTTNLTHKQIATMFGKTENNIYQMIKRLKENRNGES